MQLSWNIRHGANSLVDDFFDCMSCDPTILSKYYLFSTTCRHDTKTLKNDFYPQSVGSPLTVSISYIMLSNIAFYSWPEWWMRSQSWRVTMTFRSTMCEHYSITVSYIENRQRLMSNCMPTLFSKHFRHGEPFTTISATYHLQQQHLISLSLQIQTESLWICDHTCREHMIQASGWIPCWLHMCFLVLPCINKYEQQLFSNSINRSDSHTYLYLIYKMGERIPEMRLSCFLAALNTVYTLKAQIDIHQTPAASGLTGFGSLDCSETDLTCHSLAVRVSFIF